MLRLIAKSTHRLLRVMDRPVPTPFDGRPRGVALMLALVTLAILSTAVVEFAYTARVNTAMSTNERDKLKSYYLAKSGVNLSRLLLSLQYALQDESRQTDDETGRMIGRAMRRSNFQLYQYMDILLGPFNSGKVEIPLASIDLSSMGVSGFGEFTGTFDVDVVPEEGRINLNQFAGEELNEGDLLMLCSMMLDSRYDSIFEVKDVNGDTMNRARMMERIIDFVDLDQEQVTLGDDCTIRGSGGDEQRVYERDEAKVEPRNARLTHLEDIHRVMGVSEAFMEVFGDAFTVYDVDRPNPNVASFPVFYAILCQNLELEGVDSGGQGLGSLCANNPQVGLQVMYFAMALDGVRAFFENPLSMFMAYVGSSESRLLPGAEVGQPVAFLRRSQLPEYIEGFKTNPQLMAQFINYSPAYQVMAMENPQLVVDPLVPAFPQWAVSFNRSGLLRSISTSQSSIYRIKSTGTYGSSKAEIEAVVDFGKTQRRLPDERLFEALQGEEDDEEANEEVEELRSALKSSREEMAKGRVLYWRVQ
ncbi:type II secretion system protein GspK [Lujinxingia litoralis]|nr:type II secretion system protein GspK [Lujinxingia litoralis]